MPVFGFVIMVNDTFFNEFINETEDFFAESSRDTFQTISEVRTKDADTSNNTVQFNFDSNGNFSINEYMSLYLGPTRNKFPTVTCLTIIYTTIFFTGLMGNLFTFVVILKNFYMRTVTNYYLASLAVSDILALTFGEYKIKIYI